MQTIMAGRTDQKLKILVPIYNSTNFISTSNKNGKPINSNYSRFWRDTKYCGTLTSSVKSKVLDSNLKNDNVLFETIDDVGTIEQ